MSADLIHRGQHRMAEFVIAQRAADVAGAGGGGRVAGENALGGQARFAGSLGTQVVKVFDLVAARTGLREHEAHAADRGWTPVTTASSPDDHKAYYPGATPINIRITGDHSTGQLLGAQLVGHRSAEIAKRVDTCATALFHTMTIDAISELDLSYTPAARITLGRNPSRHPGVGPRTPAIDPPTSTNRIALAYLDAVAGADQSSTAGWRRSPPLELEWVESPGHPSVACLAAAKYCALPVTIAPTWRSRSNSSNKRGKCGGGAAQTDSCRSSPLPGPLSTQCSCSSTGLRHHRGQRTRSCGGPTSHPQRR